MNPTHELENTRELEKRPTTRDLVKYAGAVGDFNEHHYDLPFIQSLGIPNVLVHGSLQAAWLAQLATDWAGPDATVVDFDATYVGMAFPGTYMCYGRIVSRDRNRLTLELWGEDPHGKRCTAATVVLETERDET